MVNRTGGRLIAGWEVPALRSFAFLERICVRTSVQLFFFNENSRSCCAYCVRLWDTTLTDLATKARIWLAPRPQTNLEHDGSHQQILFSEYFEREVRFSRAEIELCPRRKFTRIYRTLLEQYSNGRRTRGQRRDTAQKCEKFMTNFSNFRHRRR